MVETSLISIRRRLTNLIVCGMASPRTRDAACAPSCTRTTHTDVGTITRFKMTAIGRTATIG